MMTTLLYRGLNYVQHKEQKAQKDCVELTYRRNLYNTCRSDAKSELNSQLAYRGHRYQHWLENSFLRPCLSGLFFCLNDSSLDQTAINFYSVSFLLALINFTSRCCWMAYTFFVPKLFSSFIRNRVREVMHYTNIT